MKEKAKRKKIYSDLIRFYAFLALFLLSSLLVLFLSIKIGVGNFVDFRKFDYFHGSRNVFAEENARPQVILDAGHGGVDSGTVSVLGEEEKNLNLAITKKIGAWLELAGIDVIYTRTEDVMLEGGNAASSRKTRDLLGRVEAARENPNAAFISIHMNSLPIEKYNGLQVFFSPNCEESRVLAQTLQNKVRSLLQPENSREIKKAGSNIFVLDRIESTAVLIECGFLSNYEEAKRLSEEEYQNNLSFVISRAIIEFLKPENAQS